MSEKNKQVLVIGLVFAGILAFLVGYFWFVSISPSMKKNETQRKALDQKIASHNAELKKINDFLNDTAERERMMAKVADAQRRLPASRQDLEFLQLLQNALKTTGVAQSRVAPGKSVKRNMYEEIPFSVRGSARYHEFGQFINLIECHPDRFMRVSSFTLSNNDKRPSIHPMDVGITTFMFTGSVTAAPAAGAARGRR